MNIHKLFPSKFLKADDLGGREFTLTIKQLAVESVGAPPQQEDKPVLYFQGAQKGLILNRTNAMTIAALYSPETDNWAGKRVTLFSMKVKAFGAWHDAIRIKDQQPPPQKAAEPPAEDLPGDDISEADELLDGPPDLDEDFGVDDNPFDDAPQAKQPESSQKPQDARSGDLSPDVVRRWSNPKMAQEWAIKVGANENVHDAREAFKRAVKAITGRTTVKPQELQSVYEYFYGDRLEKLQLDAAEKVPA